MTREEIINEIKCLLSELNNGEDAVSYLTQNDVKWLNENIKALEQEPQTFEWCTDCKEYDQEKHCCHRWSKVIRNTVEEMKQQPCEDCISRQAVLDKKELVKLDDGQSFYCISPEDVETLPPVTPQPKIGHWIKISPAEIYECDICGQHVMTKDICAYKYCHGCGAKMVEPQESEETDADSN